MADPDRFPIIGATRDEVGEFIARPELPAYRAGQVLRWVYAAGVQSFEEMTDLSKALRAMLAERAVLHTSRVAEARTSSDGTKKLLLALADGQSVEAVMIPEGGRRTVCISSQVGCAVGCAFCASGVGGLVRNLSAGEIVEEVLHARRTIEPEASLTNVVVMGIGEPLMNYDALVRALRVLAAPWGLALSPRRVTVSTVGLPAQIRQLAEEGLGVNLAVSLHAADDVTRGRLVPHAHPVHEVLAAARGYLHRTEREVTLEYVLVKGVNDSTEDARALADLVRREPMLVNVLPLNPVPGLALEEPSPGRVERFVAELASHGVRVQRRRRRGADIEGACGQLRRRVAVQG